MANGVFDRRIDAHSLRAGGAPALYSQGSPLDVIQSWGRWKPLTFHQYLRHDASALNRLSDVMVKPHGLLDCLKLMGKYGKQVSFQRKPQNMAPEDASKDSPRDALGAALFMPNGRFLSGGGNGESDRNDFSPLDVPAYTAAPGDQMIFCGTRALAKAEKREKEETGEDRAGNDAVHTARVALFSGEEEVSS